MGGVVEIFQRATFDDGVVDGRPLGIELSVSGDVAGACAGAVGVIVLGAAAVGCCVVASEGVTRSCRHGDGGHRCVVGGSDLSSTGGSGALTIERHGVCVGRPGAADSHVGIGHGERRAVEGACAGGVTVEGVADAAAVGEGEAHMVAVAVVERVVANDAVVVGGDAAEVVGVGAVACGADGAGGDILVSCCDAARGFALGSPPAP